MHSLTSVSVCESVFIMSMAMQHFNVKSDSKWGFIYFQSCRSSTYSINVSSQMLLCCLACHLIFTLYLKKIALSVSKKNTCMDYWICLNKFCTILFLQAVIFNMLAPTKNLVPLNNWRHFTRLITLFLDIYLCHEFSLSKKC